MTKEIVISEQENIAATFENGRITEFFMNEGEQLVGDIILGKVDSTIQSIDAAFVSIGKNRNGFIHITDLCLKNAKRKTGIRNHLQPKQNILVQIAKEATGSKGPRLTGMLTIPGKYMVLTPYERKVGISKKITDNYERDRLIYISKKICQSGYGIIVRTEAMGQSEEALKEDLDFLLKRWSEILKMSETMQAPAVLYRDQDLLYRVLRDAVTPDVDKIVVDSQDARARSVDLLQSWSHNAFRLVQQNRSPVPLSHQYNVFAEIEKVLQPKAPLPSGGYLVIEKTEALTVIDVNSGSTKGTSGLNETILQTNKEAAVEIARQLKLRDIGGVIVIDFIDMLDQREQQIVWQILANAVKDDKAQPQLGYFSEFSLLEMTRHRQKKSITELLTTKCPYCDGVGYLRNNVYRADLLTTDSVRKRVNRFDDNNSNKPNEFANNKKMEDFAGNVEYVENRMNKIPPHVAKHRKENTSSNHISYPKYDRNNNRYDDNVEIQDEITQDIINSEAINEELDHEIDLVNPEVEVVDIQDNIPKIDPDSIVEEVYESIAPPDAEHSEDNNDNFVVELTKEERMYIESIEEPFDKKRSFKDKKFGKHKKDFQNKDRFNKFQNDRNDRNDRFERTDRNDRPERTDRERLELIEDESQIQRNDNHNNTQRNHSERNERNFERHNRHDRNDRFNRNDRNDRYNQKDRNFSKNKDYEPALINNEEHVSREDNFEVKNSEFLKNENNLNNNQNFELNENKNLESNNEVVMGVEVTDLDNSVNSNENTLLNNNSIAEAEKTSFIDEIVVIEESPEVEEVKIPKKRGRKPAPKKVKAKEIEVEISKVIEPKTTTKKTSELVNPVSDGSTEEARKTIDVVDQSVAKKVNTEIENSTDNNTEELSNESETTLPKPKKRGRIKSFSPKKRK